MIRRPSLKVQVIVCIALASAGAAVWSQRDPISSLISGSASTDKAPKGTQPQNRRKNAGSRALPVIVRRITMAKSDENITAVGTARARQHVMLRPKADGQLTAFFPKTGDRVKAGDIIFKLDTEQAQLAVKLAEKRHEDATRLLSRQLQLQQRQVTSSAKVADYRIDAERAKLELEQAHNTLQNLIIRAPFDGVVGLPAADVGERVTTATDLVSLDNRQKLLVEFKVPERYATRIERGDTLHVKTPSIEQKRFAGRIQYIDSRVETTSRTLKVRGVISNEKDMLRPGMSFAVQLILAGSSHPAVPELALQWRKGESYIWIVRNKQAQKVPVTTIQRQSNRVLIDGDVKPGELVVVEGVQRLRDGRAVSYEQPRPEQKPSEASRGQTLEQPRSTRS